MNKQQALDIANNLTEAVENGWLTEYQARNRFKVIVHRYKQSLRIKKLQAELDKKLLPFNMLQDLQGLK